RSHFACVTMLLQTPLCVLFSGALMLAACGRNDSRLIADLASSRWAVREAAAREAGRRGAGAARAIPALAHCLADGDWRVGAAAAEALAAIGPDAVPVLIATLSDGHGAARSNAAAALARGGAYAQEKLVAALDDERSVTRDSVADALALIGPPALPAL